MRRALAILVLSVLPFSAATALAEPTVPELVIDGANGILEAQVVPRKCPELSAGTAGLPEGRRAPGPPDAGNGLAPNAPTTAPAALPDRIHFRTETTTYNRRYWFVLSGGRIYFKSNAEVTRIEQPWAALPTPSCFDGEVAGISVDDDELVVIDSERQIYTMDGALLDPSQFNWTIRWGPLFWTGGGRTLPPGRAWAWSVSSPLEDGTFTDPAGNAHPVGDAKVSHAWLLSGHGQRLTYMDPWLPADESYEMCGPHRSRFRSVAMSASGSMVFVVNRFGDMFTRLYDFDISGPDSFFVDYAYEDQRDVADPAIQLPPERWTEQPKIPGRVTSTISIAKRGAGSIHRTLRVEGVRDGETGYWQKDVTRGSSRAWRFVETGEPLTGRLLTNPRVDTSRRELGPSENGRWASTAPAMDLVIENFNVYCSPATLTVSLPGGDKFDLTLHTTDDIRQSPRARGLDEQPRLINGTIQAPPSVLNSMDAEVRGFVERYLTGGQFTPARIDGTHRRLSFPEQNWVLQLVSPR